jgi:hypothetical protein
MNDRRSPDSVPRGVVYQRELCLHLIEPAIFLLRPLDAFEPTHREAAVFELPIVGR